MFYFLLNLRQTKLLKYFLSLFLIFQTQKSLNIIRGINYFKYDIFILRRTLHTLQNRKNIKSMHIQKYALIFKSA